MSFNNRVKFPAASLSRSLLLLPLLALAVAAPASSATPELSAEQILEQALSNGSIGFSKGTAVLEMFITDPRGRGKERTIEVKAMKDDEGLLKTMLKFVRPAEVAGMGFLVLENSASLPDQFIYMPAARVTRRVPAGKATGSLFGSDFSYVDLMPLTPTEKEQAQMTRLDDAKVSSRNTYVIATDINVIGSPYSKLITYVDRKYLIPLKIEFFDSDGKALKTLRVRELKKVEDRLIPTKLAMKNVQQGTETIVRVRDIKPDAPLTGSDFTEEALQR